MLGRGLFKSAGFPSCVIRAFSEARPKEPEAIAAARRRADANFKLPRVSSVPIVTEYQGLSLRKQRSGEAILLIFCLVLPNNLFRTEYCANTCSCRFQIATAAATTSAQ